ncbi:MAG: ATPase [Luteococcus sp.]|uniref:xylulokinase n=1 Tax=Luteococcus sp. TaxID=1969402 RepID=UPI002647CAF9|nr:FGGY-family carbohydrate kinase [Luteococcus sp.]MDN5564212.1 ATPase [Luteococcus sp.]
MTGTDTAAMDGASLIRDGKAHLGIEFGSTRIKAALVDADGRLLGSGAHDWENRYVEQNWTYGLDEVWGGLQTCVAALQTDVEARWGVRLERLGGLGISAMMHGYLAFDAQGEQLVDFRTWRNTYTTTAAARLTQAFGQNIPLRWSVSHLLHAVLEGEEHIERLDHITTLAGYVHWKLTGRKVLGVGDASGVFPIDSATGSYDATMMDAFDALPEVAQMPWKIGDLLPQVLPAGADAGSLTDEGARLLDPSGALQAGAPVAPPEGDAGTGMVATNSIRPGTGNVSAGTSAFAMVVLDRELTGIREEIDLVTTPAGDPVAMIHTNNCTGDLDAWLGMLGELPGLLGQEVDREEFYRRLFGHALEAPADCDGLLSYNYLSGEHQTGVATGRPLFLRGQDSGLKLASFLRAQLNAAFAALACGMKVLLDEEKVPLTSLFAHGGIFRTEGVAQQVLADALNTPVAVGDTAGEGGAWGMAVLAAFTALPEAERGAGLAGYLEERVFSDAQVTTRDPEAEGVAGYTAWLERYQAGLAVERLAGEVLA